MFGLKDHEKTPNVVIHHSDRKQGRLPDPAPMTANSLAVQEVYNALPTINCIGKCWDHCGPIVPALAEEDRLRELGLRPPRPHTRTLYCNKLTSDHRCTIYEDRPLICRLYGMVANEPRFPPCDFGCEPTRWLSAKESAGLLLKLRQLTGDSEERLRMHLEAIVKSPATDPIRRKMALTFLR